MRCDTTEIDATNGHLMSLHVNKHIRLEVIAFICGLMVMILLVLALISNDWLMASGWRQGLFSHCISENAPTPLPFNIKYLGPDCYKARDIAYIKVAAALCIIALLTDAMATLLTGIGLRTTDHRTKYKKQDCVGVRVGLRCRLGCRYLPVWCRCAPPLRQGIRRDLLQGEEGGRGLVRRSPARPRALAVRQGTSSSPQQCSALPVVSTQSLTICNVSAAKVNT
ncbi:unnamed protein product [Nezara viridula]|uniref:Uncharacterized protein n=1 Tax=Nezara viridula TaxID=85310 RepID=A0A9P0HNR7_NEZVI|nr:unnamed protein product [Nezara viridula]